MANITLEWDHQYQLLMTVIAQLLVVQFVREQQGFTTAKETFRTYGTNADGQKK